METKISLCLISFWFSGSEEKGNTDGEKDNTDASQEIIGFTDYSGYTAQSGLKVKLIRNGFER